MGILLVQRTVWACEEEVVVYCFLWSTVYPSRGVAYLCQYYGDVRIYKYIVDSAELVEQSSRRWAIVTAGGLLEDCKRTTKYCWPTQLQSVLIMGVYEYVWFTDDVVSRTCQCVRNNLDGIVDHMSKCWMVETGEVDHVLLFRLLVRQYWVENDRDM